MLCNYIIQKSRRGLKMIIHDYESRSGKELIKVYILNLPEEEKIDGLSVLKDMEDNKLDSLLIKRWENKIYEVYFRKHNRIFYIIKDGGINMPFKTINVSNIIEEEKRADDHFANSWDESRTEYKLMGEIIRLRKETGASCFKSKKNYTMI